MATPIPNFAQEAYAVLRSRFGDGEFDASYLSWFLSKGMVKKTLHVLERAGWISRVGRGSYVCVNPDAVFAAMVQFRVPSLLMEAGKPYAYTGASAVEVWTDYAYLQRSWEHSPYFVKVLRKDVRSWVQLFRKAKVKVFVGEAEPALGEFVVLKPQERLARGEHHALPVDPLDTTVRFCEANVDNFEYALAYLEAKFRVKGRVALDPRLASEARKAV